MQYCWGGKKSKRFSPGSDFTEQIFTGELSGVDSADRVETVCYLNKEGGGLKF